MELPEDILKIIKEYSMPITRPDWRTLHIMPDYIYKNILSRHIILYYGQNMYYVKIKKIVFWVNM
jgi:hypothetical protein